MINWDEAKQKVAKDHGFEGWDTMLSGYYALGETAHKANAEAAELYAHSAANEAVREDRWKVIERLSGTDYGLDPSEHSLILDLPLPFPDAK